MSCYFFWFPAYLLCVVPVGDAGLVSAGSACIVVRNVFKSTQKNVLGRRN